VLAVVAADEVIFGSTYVSSRKEGSPLFMGAAQWGISPDDLNVIAQL
jgi:hypothetical protein